MLAAERSQTLAAAGQVLQELHGRVLAASAGTVRQLTGTAVAGLNWSQAARDQCWSAPGDGGEAGTRGRGLGSQG